MNRRLSARVVGASLLIALLGVLLAYGPRLSAQEPAAPLAGTPVYVPLILNQSDVAPESPGTIRPAAPNWMDTNLSGELGMSAVTYQKLVQDAKSGRFDRACTAAEHNRDTWHTLLNYDALCHYDHHHGDNPNAVSDIFGAPGAWYGTPGRSVAYPWQTFPIADGEMNPNVQPAAGVKLENESKHEGFIWIVRRNQSCNGGRYCVKDFRLQIHFHSTHDAPVRWHSYSIEARLCVDPNSTSTCGLYKLGGWIDYARLFVPPSSAGDCWTAYNGALERNANFVQYVPHITELPNYNQFYRAGSDEKPFDELRCHKSIPSNLVTANPNGFARASEWWGHSPFDFRYQVRVWNPHTDVGTDAIPNAPFCTPSDPTCRWTFSRFTVELDYVIPVHPTLDRNGDKITDARGWINRLGGANPSCKAAGLNCIPADITGVRINPGGLGYNHDLSSGTPHDYDITPVGRPSWVTWFHKYGH